jgi:hypothetical protein
MFSTAGNEMFILGFGIQLAVLPHWHEDWQSFHQGNKGPFQGPQCLHCARSSVLQSIQSAGRL